MSNECLLSMVGKLMLAEDKRDGKLVRSVDDFDKLLLGKSKHACSILNKVFINYVSTDWKIFGKGFYYIYLLRYPIRSMANNLMCMFKDPDSIYVPKDLILQAIENVNDKLKAYATKIENGDIISPDDFVEIMFLVSLYIIDYTENEKRLFRADYETINSVHHYTEAMFYNGAHNIFFKK